MFLFKKPKQNKNRTCTSRIYQPAIVFIRIMYVSLKNFNIKICFNFEVVYFSRANSVTYECLINK